MSLNNYIKEYMDYKGIYDNLISRAKSEVRYRGVGVYYEGHHIIPRCLGGEGRAKDPSHPNIVLLTAKEHYMAHRLLCQIYPENKKLQYALNMMITHTQDNKRYIPSGRIFAKIKESNIKVPVSAETREKISTAMKCRGPVSAETREKLSKRIVSLETRKKLSDAKKNVSLETREKLSKRIISEETKRKISEKMKGRSAWNKGISRTLWT